MKKSPLTVLSLLGALAGCSTIDHTENARALFNGRDLTGWVVMHGGDWSVEDGVLVGRNGKDWSTNPQKSGSWLRTEKKSRRPQACEKRSSRPRKYAGATLFLLQSPYVF